MVWLGLLSAVALAVALVAFASVRRLRRRLEQLQQSYWDLRYEHGRLKAQVKQLDPEAQAPAETPEPAPAASTTFIPLSSLKR
jgi:cell division protein FtsB